MGYKTFSNPDGSLTPWKKKMLKYEKPETSKNERAFEINNVSKYDATNTYEKLVLKDNNPMICSDIQPTGFKGLRTWKPRNFYKSKNYLTSSGLFYGS